MKNLVVTYKFSSSSMIREPLFLIGAYFGFFLLAICYFRSNFRLHDAPLGGSLSEAEKKARKLVGELSDIFDSLEKKFEQINPKENTKALQKKLQKYNTDVAASATQIQSLVSKISSARSDLGAGARRAEQFAKDRVVAFRQKLSFSAAPSNEEVKKQLAQLEDQFVTSGSSLRNEVEELIAAAERPAEEE